MHTPIVRRRDTAEGTHDGSDSPDARSGMRRLLLIEDDPAVADGTMELLRDEGFEVRTLDSGVNAVHEIESFRPDAVILDRGLPQIDGEQVLAAIRGRFPRLGIIFTSGDANPAVASGQGGRVIVLQKPYDIDEILNALASLAHKSTR